MTIGEQMRLDFEKLPQIDQEEVLGTLHLILKWRGWDRIGGITGRGNPRQEQIDKIANVFARNGMEIEEFT